MQAAQGQQQVVEGLLLAVLKKRKRVTRRAVTLLLTLNERCPSITYQRMCRANCCSSWGYIQKHLQIQ
jgi:hypothetical protein